MKYEIELPDVMIDVKGNQYEPTGEYRQPNPGEYFLDDENTVCYVGRSRLAARYPILRPTWTWPEWLSGWGFALDSDGNFYWYENEPVKSDKDWDTENEIKPVRITDNIRRMIPSLPPLPTDWKKPILNPNYVSPNKEDDGTEHDPE